MSKVFLLQFNPAEWTYLHKLHLFSSAAASTDSNVRIGLRDCEAHFDKVEISWRIAERVRPTLVIDREELEKFGGTRGSHSKEFALVCETIITTLYSAIDGLRTFLFGAYRKVRRVQNGSNGALFLRAAQNEYGPEFPEEIRQLLEDAWHDWFRKLRAIRTELTHGSTGTCHLDVTSDRIAYLNQGTLDNQVAFHIDDIETYLRGVEEKVRSLVEDICKFHYLRLDNTPRFVICGWYLARYYARMVSPRADLSWSDGHCLSYQWFEKDTEVFCPIANRCPAYLKKWPGGLSAALSAS